jgi:hypothetical protein
VNVILEPSAASAEAELEMTHLNRVSLARTLSFMASTENRATVNPKSQRLLARMALSSVFRDALAWNFLFCLRKSRAQIA